MKVMMQTWLCYIHAHELVQKLAYNSERYRLLEHFGAITCQAKHCHEAAIYRVYVWTEIRRHKA